MEQLIKHMYFGLASIGLARIVECYFYKGPELTANSDKNLIYTHVIVLLSIGLYVNICLP